MPLVLLALLSGCATKWTPRTAQSPVAMQWPYQPNRAKLSYVQSLAGFSRNGGAGSVMRVIVYGAEAQDPNTFVLPVAIAIGHDGRMAVADRGAQCVHLYIPGEQRYVRLTGPGGRSMASPVAVAFDEELRLYVADSAGQLLFFGADGALRFTRESAGAEALQRPSGIAYSPRTKRLFVVDALAQKVQIFATNGDWLSSFGGRGEGEGQFNFPSHIFRSAAGELYVADSLNFRVQIFDEDGHVRGVFGHHGDGSGDMAMPKGVAADRDGIVYVVDGMFAHVQLFDRQGRFMLTVGREGSDFGDFWLPSGAFIDENDQLYVCDTYNRRVQVFRITAGY